MGSDRARIPLTHRSCWPVHPVGRRREHGSPLQARPAGGPALRPSGTSRNVIERAGLRDTGFPDGPHSQIYEAWFGKIDPPRDFSVYDMSWVGPAASLISTVTDLNRFFGMLLAGEIVGPSSLAQMQRTVPVISQERGKIDYGLGLHPTEAPGQDTFWGPMAARSGVPVRWP